MNQKSKRNGHANELVNSGWITEWAHERSIKRLEMYGEDNGYNIFFLFFWMEQCNAIERDCGCHCICICRHCQCCTVIHLRLAAAATATVDTTTAAVSLPVQFIKIVAVVVVVRMDIQCSFSFRIRVCACHSPLYSIYSDSHTNSNSVYGAFDS